MTSFLISLLIVSVAGYFFVQQMQQRLDKKFKQRMREFEDKVEKSKESDHNQIDH